MPGEEQDAPVDRQDKTVTVPEAARLLGKSADAVRSALRRGSLEGYRDNQGEWRIPLTGLPDRQATPDDHLRQELEQARRQADDRQATVVELRERLARLEGELAGVKATAMAEVNAAVRTAEEAIAAKEELVRELREALAWHRRPWWRRWFSNSE